MGRFIRVLVMTIVVVGLVVLGVGYYQGWFTTTTEHEGSGDGKVVVALEVDTDKIKADTEAARRSVESVSDTVKDKIRDLTGATTVQGKVVNVDETSRSFTLQTDEGKELTFHMAPKAELKLKRSNEPRELRSGDHVSVVYKSEDGKYLAHSITAVKRG